MQDLELWGGHECTVNRVGDVYFDQNRRSGHHDRPEDLEAFAELGLKALRYPVLWERVAPEQPDRFDWRWSDERLAMLDRLNVEPIVGLLHHGSGPRYTNLLDPSFAEGLANFAGAVAERYPHVRDWTPVNEPLTTARFSALYGLWYPHRTDERAFWEALLNEIDGVRLAMQRIRAVNPAARLIQTEDFGRTYSTRAVAHQASYDNERRWMTWDLLEGRVTRDHRLWERLDNMGFGDRLRRIADAPCPPDVIGLNHYLTSDRHLDHRLELYPPHTHGGNAFTRFADVEAVRVVAPAPGGLAGALEEVWARYGRTLAVTEAHSGCTREEQIRWLDEAWTTAEDLRRRGVDVAAVTAWALLGSYDWNTLLVRPGAYEPGAFDLSGGEPRATGIATTIRALAGRAARHPVAGSPGWWRRDIRFTYAPVFRLLQAPQPRASFTSTTGSGRPILITGATGTLGAALARSCEWRGLDYVLTDRSILALDDEASIARALELYAPWAVINAAGWVRVDDAETNAEACLATNTEGAIRLARACAARDIGFVGVSTDLVFDGRAGEAYAEDAEPRPLNVYGRSKLEAERGVLEVNDRALMVRTAAFFSPYDPHNFAAHVLASLAAGKPVKAASDLIVSPTFVPDLTDAVLDLAVDGETGLWHVANEGEVSWADFARMIAAAFEFDPAAVEAVPWRSFGWAAERPGFAALTSRRGRLMPSLEDALGRYTAALIADGFEGPPERLPEPMLQRRQAEAATT